MSIWLIFPLLFPLQINSIHARRKRVFKICKSMSAILALDTQTETETPILRLRLRLRLAVRYLWDTRARRELSNAISRPAARFDGSLCWRFVAVVELALVFENLDSFIWAALKTKRIRQIRNTTRLRQKYNNNKQNCFYNLNIAMHNLFRESWKYNKSQQNKRN